MSFSDLNQTIYLILTTEVDRNNAEKIAHLLLKEKLIPCVTFTNVDSQYWWEGEVMQSKEIQLLIKCKEANLTKVCNKISEYHSYELPEIICFPVSVSKEYHRWVDFL